MKNKRAYRIIIGSVLAACVILSGVIFLLRNWQSPDNAVRKEETGINNDERSGGRALTKAYLDNMEKRKVTPYDYISAAQIGTQEKKSYTIMIYMNGSDLETFYSAATRDIAEMCGAQFDEEHINVLIFAGGSERWHMEEVPDEKNNIFRIQDGKLQLIAEAGEDSMGEAEVLSGFLRFGEALFPADKYGLILWNHGGGAVIGYGSDERYEEEPNIAEMKLSDIEDALFSGGLSQKLEFMGFDTCLMATLEMANIAQNYAKLLIASEEVETEYGWDYGFLGNITPTTDYRGLGRVIMDSYASFYDESELEDFVTLSVVELANIEPVTQAVERLAASGQVVLDAGDYELLSKARSQMRTFGSGGEDGETDMVDVLEMAVQLYDLFPEESGELISALQQAVLYQYESQTQNLGGLSIYYPFYNKEDLEVAVAVYQSMEQLPDYTKFITKFCEVLNNSQEEWEGAGTFSGGSEILVVEKSANTRFTLWQKVSFGEGDILIQVGDDAGAYTLQQNQVCLYQNNNEQNRFTIPIQLNGKDANAIVIFNEEYPDGKIIGAIPINDDIFSMVDKKLIIIKEGDRLAIRYYALKYTDSEEIVDDKQEDLWYVGEEFTVHMPLQLEAVNPEEQEYIRKWNVRDAENNSHYIDAE